MERRMVASMKQDNRLSAVCVEKEDESNHEMLRFTPRDAVNGLCRRIVRCAKAKAKRDEVAMIRAEEELNDFFQLLMNQSVLN